MNDIHKNNSNNHKIQTNNKNSQKKSIQKQINNNQQRISRPYYVTSAPKKYRYTTSIDQTDNKSDNDFRQKKTKIQTNLKIKQQSLQQLNLKNKDFYYSQKITKRDYYFILKRFVPKKYNNRMTIQQEMLKANFNPIKQNQNQSYVFVKTKNKKQTKKEQRSKQKVITLEQDDDQPNKISNSNNSPNKNKKPVYFSTIPKLYPNNYPYLDLFMTELGFFRGQNNGQFDKKKSYFQQKRQIALRNNNEKSQIFVPKAGSPFCMICSQDIPQILTQQEHFKTLQHKQKLKKSKGQKFILETIQNEQKLKKLMMMNHDYNLSKIQLKSSTTKNPLIIKQGQQIQISSSEEQKPVMLYNRKRKKAVINSYNENIISLSQSIEQIKQPLEFSNPRKVMLGESKKFLKTAYINTLNTANIKTKMQVHPICNNSQLNNGYQFNSTYKKNSNLLYSTQQHNLKHQNNKIKDKRKNVIDFSRNQKKSERISNPNLFNFMSLPNKRILDLQLKNNNTSYYGSSPNGNLLSTRHIKNINSKVVLDSNNLKNGQSQNIISQKSIQNERLLKQRSKQKQKQQYFKKLNQIQKNFKINKSAIKNKQKIEKNIKMSKQSNQNFKSSSAKVIGCKQKSEKQQNNPLVAQIKQIIKKNADRSQIQQQQKIKQ